MERAKKILSKSIKRNNPKDLSELIQKTKLCTKLSEEEIVDLISELEDEKSVKLVAPLVVNNGWNTLFSLETLSFWVIVILCSIILGLTLFAPNTVSFVLYVQYFFGVPFVLYLPGYSLMNVIFPKQAENSQTNLGSIDRFLLNFFFSLALTAVLSFILAYAPWGLNAKSFVLCMFTIIISLSIYSLFKTYRKRKHSIFRRARKNNAYFEA